MKKPPIIKVCGMREPENIFQISHLPIDEIGVIFYENSDRFVEEHGLATIFLRQVPQKRVGVFVDAPKEYVYKKIKEYNLDKVQLHGHESPEYCTEIKSYGVQVVKVIHVKEDNDLNESDIYMDVVDQFLFDTRGKLPGGNGYTFDWTLLEKHPINKPFMLSGGIGPEHIDKIKSLSLENCIGIDLNSRFEIEPGFKDVDGLRTFVNALKQ